MRQRGLVVLLVAAVAFSVFTFARAAMTNDVPNRTIHHTEVPKDRPQPRNFPIGLAFGESLAHLSRPDMDRALADTVDLGANWIKIDLSWASIQPSDQAHFEWADTDRAIDAARRHGLKVLGVVTYTPPWARSRGCRTFSCPPARAADFAAFAAAVVAHYGNRVATVQVWNEPNLSMFWVRPDPGRYADLLRATVVAIRHEHWRGMLLFAGLATRLHSSAVSFSAPDFLTAVCRLGACRGVQGVGYHPYTYPELPSHRSDPPNAWQRLTTSTPTAPSMWSALHEAGLEHAELWITEYGAPSATPGEHFQPPLVDEAEQGRIIADAVHLAARARGVIGGLFIYTWRDLPTRVSKEGHFGLRRADGSAKPAYGAVKRAVADLRRTSKVRSR